MELFIISIRFLNKILLHAISLSLLNTRISLPGGGDDQSSDKKEHVLLWHTKQHS